MALPSRVGRSPLGAFYRSPLGALGNVGGDGPPEISSTFKIRVELDKIEFWNFSTGVFIKSVDMSTVTTKIRDDHHDIVLKHAFVGSFYSSGDGLRGRRLRNDAGTLTANRTGAITFTGATGSIYDTDPWTRPTLSKNATQGVYAFDAAGTYLRAYWKWEVTGNKALRGYMIEEDSVPTPLVLWYWPASENPAKQQMIVRHYGRIVYESV